MLDPFTCPEFWQQAGKNCYLVSPGSMNWFAAQEVKENTPNSILTNTR